MTPEEQAMVTAIKFVAAKLTREIRAGGDPACVEMIVVTNLVLLVRDRVVAERSRCAKIADEATTGLTGFVESDRMEFAVKNMAKLREAIAARIREGGAA